MDIHSVRQQLRMKSIYDIPLRVTYYARVSSESDEQLNSLGNQISYYEDFIRKNAAWTFVPGYIDEGLSGISTKRRENFNRMVDDAEVGKFDLVITKEISRFARNTLDSIQYTRAAHACADPVSAGGHGRHKDTFIDKIAVKFSTYQQININYIPQISPPHTPMEHCSSSGSTRQGR